MSTPPQSPRVAPAGPDHQPGDWVLHRLVWVVLALQYTVELALDDQGIGLRTVSSDHLVGLDHYGQVALRHVIHQHSLHVVHPIDYDVSQQLSVLESRRPDRDIQVVHQGWVG